MLVVTASHMGMCFGVEDALDIARSVERPEAVTIYGELVHNSEVQQELASRGFRALPERGRRLPDTPEVMITAHGISGREQARLESAGKKLLDTTCPLVRRVHKAALRLDRLGYLVLVVGRPGHVEVEGIVGDLDHYVVVPTPEAVETYAPARLGVVAQTTTPPREFRAVVRAIRSRNPGKEIQVADTVCRPTRDRQDALVVLLHRVEAMVVVGGRNSNNTRQLGLLAAEKGKPWLHVERPEELDPDWFKPYRIVGLTAGTSTPQSTVDAVYRTLLAIARRARLTA
ncbi:MAG: 4-hydroxy-3-methylbut-2-enyl diphosphate reductase [Armatimonadetes bacterium]|nr:4-hydroxy-3-methylbut-2-enyl diphosphate reductase [Armatimonadota bacterium]